VGTKVGSSKMPHRKIGLVTGAYPISVKSPLGTILLRALY